MAGTGRQTICNNLTTPELIKQINPENVSLMNDYLTYLKSVQRSETTIGAYESDLRIAFVWNLQYNNNKSFIDWTKRNVVSYQNWLINDNKNSPARVRRLKASLSSLSNYIENVLDDEFPNFRNIINKIENPVNRPIREKTVWEDSELEELLDKLVEKNKIKQACYLALGMYSGRRKAELCIFKMSDFDDDKLVCDGALYKSAPIKTKGRGGGKYISCYTLARKFKPYLDMWIKYREEHGIESEYLFPNKYDHSKPIAPAAANTYAELYSQISGKPCYIHSLRHYFTTSLAKAGIPDSVIQTIVNWESSDMVRIYKDIDAEDEIGEYFKGGEIVAKEKKGLSDL